MSSSRGPFKNEFDPDFFIELFQTFSSHFSDGQLGTLADFVDYEIMNRVHSQERELDSYALDDLDLDTDFDDNIGNRLEEDSTSKGPNYDCTYTGPKGDL